MIKNNNNPLDEVRNSISNIKTNNKQLDYVNDILKDNNCPLVNDLGEIKGLTQDNHNTFVVRVNPENKIKIDKIKEDFKSIGIFVSNSDLVNYLLNNK